jgi:uncharacterized membrane protein YedE/YeeE
MPDPAPSTRRTPAPYANPYLAGIGLGLVLLAAFVTMGHGLGASGAVASVVSAGVGTVAPAHAAASEFYRPYLADGPGGALSSWIVIELLGVAAGGYLSARLAGRVHRAVERGPRARPGTRLAYALGGGAVMGFATRLARGCTSGQALTGGALLNVGSWAFTIALFASAYAVARLVRRQWT